MLKRKTYFEQVPVEAVLKITGGQTDEEKGPMPITVLLGDRSRFARRLILELLEDEPRIEVVGEVTTFAGVLEMASVLKPDVLLVDVHMPDERQLRTAHRTWEMPGNAKCVLAVSASHDAAAKELAGRLGARALLDKGHLADELVPAILRHANGVGKRGAI